MAANRQNMQREIEFVCVNSWFYNRNQIIVHDREGHFPLFKLFHFL